jgi:positive regulator of sigma E activity
MECQAKVVRANQQEALVRVAQVNCAECRGCGLFARNQEHTMEFTTVNRLGVHRGDEVILQVPSRRLSLTYLIIFGLPVLVMLAAYFIGMAFSVLLVQGGSHGVGIILAVVSGLIAFWGGVKLAERIGLYPTILRVIEKPQGEDGEEAAEEKEDDAEDYSGRVL